MQICRLIFQRSKVFRNFKYHEFVFKCLEPNAKSIILYLDSDSKHSSEDLYPLERNHSGEWRKNLKLSPGRYEYKFLVDSNWKTEPKGFTIEVPTMKKSTRIIKKIISTKSAERNEWNENMKHFFDTRRQLLHDINYRGKFVAIIKREIVDSDENKFTLARRVTKKFPSDEVLIKKVEDKEQPVDMPTPEFIE